MGFLQNTFNHYKSTGQTDRQKIFLYLSEVFMSDFWRINYEVIKYQLGFGFYQWL